MKIPAALVGHLLTVEDWFSVALGGMSHWSKCNTLGHPQVYPPPDHLLNK